MPPKRIPTPLVEQIASKDPLVGLRAVAALRLLADQLERVHVDNARARGVTWQRIALALGVTKQAAHEKHAQRFERGADERED